MDAPVAAITRKRHWALRPLEEEESRTPARTAPLSRGASPELLTLSIRQTSTLESWVQYSIKRSEGRQGGSWAGGKIAAGDRR